MSYAQGFDLLSSRYTQGSTGSYPNQVVMHYHRDHPNGTRSTE